METTYRVLRIEEQLYGCEELPAGQPVLCDVTLADPAGARRGIDCNQGAGPWQGGNLRPSPPRKSDSP